MALQDEILRQSAQIKTDSYPMSIGELLNLYRDGELDVHPEFQRVYRWSDLQKTRLIESILLGIPIPPIFVAQRTDGIWDVVDGVQRLSTILQFVGELKDENDDDVKPLVLEGTQFLPSLKGKTWTGRTGFTPEQRRYVKRAKIDMKIVLKESDDKSKYELFMRLNTGGTALTPQEVRNCLMIMAFPEMYKWIRKLSESKHFKETISLTERAITEQYPMELATRFLAFRTLPGEELREVEDIGEYLNSHLESMASQLSGNHRAMEEHAFKETFRILSQELQDDAFRRYDAEKRRFMGSFSIAGFEAIALGIGYNVKTTNTLKINRLRERVQAIWSEPDFENYSGSGVRASARIPKIVPLGRRIFSDG